MKSFLEALLKFLKSMPDFQPLEAIDIIRAKSSVHPPGIADFDASAEREPGPLRILWAARWEHDKNPELFFKALEILKEKKVRFRLSVIGQSFRDQPDVFADARKSFSDHIDHWGYQKTRPGYESILRKADVIVSTAEHEFFGISLVEAIASGAYPLVPYRLSYPEIIGLAQIENKDQFFYNGSPADLADKLIRLASLLSENTLSSSTANLNDVADRFKWKNLIPLYDRALEQICRNRR
jgi:glycosyltransferase involved in cell wall biosynthesis